MGEIFFTSDTHFCHTAKFLWEPRGFSSTEEMNEALIENWNKTVPEGQNIIVYHLGDIALSDTEAAIPYIKCLHGKIKWLRGNHDSDARVKRILEECHNVVSCDEDSELPWAYVMKDGKRRIYMSHYPTLTSNYDDKHFSQHIFSLHGHTHQQKNWLDLKNPFLYHVGLDSHNNAPVAYEEIMTDIRQRWNELGGFPAPVKPEDIYPYANI